MFSIAGIAKLTDRVGTSQMVTTLGVPETITPAASILLPLAEIVVAIVLWLAATAGWGASAALMLIGNIPRWVSRCTSANQCTPDGYRGFLKAHFGSGGEFARFR